MAKALICYGSEHSFEGQILEIFRRFLKRIHKPVFLIEYNIESWPAFKSRVEFTKTADIDYVIFVKEKPEAGENIPTLKETLDQIMISLEQKWIIGNINAEDIDTL